MSANVYSNMLLLEGPNLELRRHAYIAVEDQSIAEVGDHWRGESLDLDGAIVFPAFVDAHTHVADSGIKDAVIGLATAEAVSPPDGLKYRFLQEIKTDDLQRILVRAVQELLSNGICAFADFREGCAEGVELLRTAVSGIPIRAVILGDALVPPSDSEYMTQIRDAASASDGIGIGDVARYTDEQLSEITAILHETASILAVHTAETKEAQSACRDTWGSSEVARILAHGPDLLVHLTNPLAGDVELLRQAQVPVVCCPRTNAILADGLPPVADLIASGVPLALGTDNMMLSSPDMFREMDWFSRLARGQSGRSDVLSSRDVLSMATLGGARAVGLDDELGSIEAGKAACFVALDAGSANLAGTRDIHAAIVHRAGPQDISLVVSWGEEVSRRSTR